MASSSTSAPPAEPQSYTTMSTSDNKDLDSIGAHCHYTYCNQLDFLPFRCESCKYTYCLDHRTETSHSCPKAGEWAKARRAAEQTTSSSTTSSLGNGKPTLSTATQCSHPSCKTYINTHISVGVGCQNCNRQYCLKHRLREDHDCKNLTPLGARPAGSSASSGSTQAEKAKAALGRLRIWGQQKQASISLPKTKAASAAASRIVDMNKLKRAAKGDEKVSVEKRVYLYVEAEASTTTSKLPKGEFYYSREWSVGRMLDAAAKGLQVANVNNRVESEEERLRVFHVEAGRLLGFSDKVGDVCVNGNTVVLLRGVGPALENP